MLNAVCAEVRNYFTRDEDVHAGKYTISGGNLAPLDFLQDGQYFRVVGSAFNDGVYKHPFSNFTAEEFDGAVWAMRIPPDFIQLCRDIKKYTADVNGGNPSAYTSESYGGYSYSKATAANGAPLDWHDVFARRLNAWRKI